MKDDSKVDAILVVVVAESDNVQRDENGHVPECPMYSGGDSGSIRSRVATNAYRDGYDRIFGKRDSALN
jgi:hypothetical protein